MKKGKENLTSLIAAHHFRLSGPLVTAWFRAPKLSLPFLSGSD